MKNRLIIVVMPFVLLGCKTHAKRELELSNCRKSLMVLATLMDQEVMKKGLQPSLNMAEIEAMPSYKESQTLCPGLHLVQGVAYPQAKVVWDLEQERTCTMVAEVPGPNLIVDDCPGSITAPPKQ